MVELSKTGTSSSQSGLGNMLSKGAQRATDFAKSASSPLVRTAGAAASGTSGILGTAAKSVFTEKVGDVLGGAFNGAVSAAMGEKPAQKTSDSSSTETSGVTSQTKSKDKDQGTDKAKIPSEVTLGDIKKLLQKSASILSDNDKVKELMQPITGKNAKANIFKAIDSFKKDESDDNLVALAQSLKDNLSEVELADFIKGLDGLIEEKKTDPANEEKGDNGDALKKLLEGSQKKWDANKANQTATNPTQAASENKENIDPISGQLDNIANTKKGIENLTKLEEAEADLATAKKNYVEGHKQREEATIVDHFKAKATQRKDQGGVISKAAQDIGELQRSGTGKLKEAIAQQNARAAQEDDMKSRQKEQRSNQQPFGNYQG